MMAVGSAAPPVEDEDEDSLEEAPVEAPEPPVDEAPSVVVLVLDRVGLWRVLELRWVDAPTLALAAVLAEVLLALAVRLTDWEPCASR
jgi:hypothetical protein